MARGNPGTEKRIVIYVMLSFFIGWLVALLIPLFGLTYGDKASILILAAMMFTPALSSILTRLITKESFKDMYLHPNFKGNLRKYSLVFFGPSLLLLFSGVVYFLLFPGMFDTSLSQLNEIIAGKGPAGLTAVNMLIISIIQIVIIGPFINIIPTLGEEIGWRGYLLPKLRELYATRTALLVSGAIWGFWHLPAIVMGHNYGTDYFGYPYLGVLAMIIFCIVLGIIEGYATIELNSVIPAAMIHSTLNAGAALPMVIVKQGYNPLIGPAITGLVGGIPFIIVSIILFLKADGRRSTPK
ncbi:MAG: CPBP family intramembrane metalloprotease [Firmicutes bacterium]|nr:CPBP family intramembrane metalloprotease [Bacillota bacterium]